MKFDFKFPRFIKLLIISLLISILFITLVIRINEIKDWEYSPQQLISGHCSCFGIKIKGENEYGGKGYYCWGKYSCPIE